MALDQSALLELLEALKAAEVDDRIRSVTETLYQALIEAELIAVIGATPHERTETRTAQRSGSRPRALATTVHRRRRRSLQPRRAAAPGRRRARRGHDEWQVSDRCYLFEGSMAAVLIRPEEVAQPALFAS
jgi:transposase-like protein